MQHSEARTLHRPADPETSAWAAESVVSGLARQHRQIIEALRIIERPLAAEELGDLIGVPVWRRMNELERKGWIYPTSEYHRNRSGRLARRYALTKRD